ncbi:MAG: hypothetical protein ACKO96_12255, partial [Flammeovirgaceae bacterium]
NYFKVVRRLMAWDHHSCFDNYLARQSDRVVRPTGCRMCVGISVVGAVCAILIKKEEFWFQS